MELRHLRYFETIAEEQSFRRASARLHVSQSPLSRQMKDLEEEMGVELFEPEGRGIKLTTAGKSFAERARSILARVDAAVDEAKGIAEGRVGFQRPTADSGCRPRFAVACSGAWGPRRPFEQQVDIATLAGRAAGTWAQPGLRRLEHSTRVRCGVGELQRRHGQRPTSDRRRQRRP